MMNNEQHKTPVSAPVDSFQGRVQPWMMACFGAEISADGAERNHRLLEESLELVQACGCTASEAHQLVEYVYGRPVGERAQEVGGVMVTLAALCLAQGLDMQAAGETELARIWTKVEAIRAKQAAKPKHSPLPAAACQVVADERELPPLPEMASAADLAYVMQTPEDWDPDYRDTWQKLQVEASNKRQWRKYALELRAALAASTVQAQEPVKRKCNRFDHSCNCTNDCPEMDQVGGPPRAPVQPGAVPDGMVDPTYMTEEQGRDWAWKDVKKDVGTSGWTAGDNGNYFGFFAHGWNYRGQFEKQRAAAPAAQGDAKDAELDRIKRLATCGTVDSFLLLPEQDKRYWFAMTWQESDLRKLAEERMAFLHSTNKDADGYEFGIAKVKFDAAGKIESFLWGLGDSSDLDAAIAAKAAS
jgi:hypothetical protein